MPIVIALLVILLLCLFPWLILPLLVGLAAYGAWLAFLAAAFLIGVIGAVAWIFLFGRRKSAIEKQIEKVNREYRERTESQK